MQWCPRAAFFGLLGWYLMTPPMLNLWEGKDLTVCTREPFPCGPSFKPDISAPISKWRTAQVFDSAKACKKALQQGVRGYHETARKLADQLHKDIATVEAEDTMLGPAILNAQCVATDDPRLKEYYPETR
jgi:hypothetical protein